MIINEMIFKMNSFDIILLIINDYNYFDSNYY